MSSASLDMKSERLKNGTALTIEFAPDLSVIGAMLDVIEGFLADNDVEASLGKHVMLAAEELVANAIAHGHAVEAETAVVLDVGCEPGRIVTQIVYPGLEFDPTKPVARPSDRYAEPGGFGLDLVWNVVDEITYQRRGDLNVVRLSHDVSR